MRDQNNIQDELRNLNSGLPHNNSQTPFSVPDGYFEGLAASILANVKEQDVSEEIKNISPFLAGISKRMPYSVPENYFERNIESLPSINTEIESPVLSVIGKEMPYEVPVGYFGNLPDQIVEKILNQRPKVVSIFGRRWMKVAVAAVITGIVAIAGYNYFSSKSVISNQLNQPIVVNNNVVKDLKNVSTTEMDAFINNVGANTEKTTASLDNNNGKEKVKEMLKDVPDKEIDNFLQQVPTADDELASTDEP